MNPNSFDAEEIRTILIPLHPVPPVVHLSNPLPFAAHLPTELNTCSTYRDRISNILKIFESIDIVEKINFLVTHQVPDDMCLSDESNSVILRLESHPSIDYIKNPSKGLTLIRNIALKKNTIYVGDG